jgi:hypothetical protein
MARRTAKKAFKIEEMLSAGVNEYRIVDRLHCSLGFVRDVAKSQIKRRRDNERERSCGKHPGHSG